jgi:hypothetical protein
VSSVNFCHFESARELPSDKGNGLQSRAIHYLFSQPRNAETSDNKEHKNSETIIRRWPSRSFCTGGPSATAAPSSEPGRATAKITSVGQVARIVAHLRERGWFYSQWALS